MAIMPSDLGLYMDENDPTEPGDIKVVKGTIVPIDSCDVLTGWTVESGGGVTLVLSAYDVIEGTASLSIMVPASTTGVILFTHADTVNLSACDWLRFNLKRIASVGWSTSLTFHAHFGEDGGAYTDQTMGNFTLPNGNAWYEKAWDISAIADADKTTVKYFALNIVNASGTKPALIHLDYIWGDPGPSSVCANDGDRVINLYPKIYVGSYTGTTAHQTITIPRKGIPAYIRTIRFNVDEPPVLWLKGFGEYSMADYIADPWYASEGGIHNVLDGSFDLAGAALGCNVNGAAYKYMVMWED
jgi:hypothetical protein